MANIPRINPKIMKKIEPAPAAAAPTSSNLLDQTIEELESKQRKDLLTREAEKQSERKVTYQQALHWKGVRKGYAAKGRYQEVAKNHPGNVKKPKRFRAADEAWAKLSMIKHSMKKMENIVWLIRKKTFAEAIKQLQLCGKAVAPDLIKLLLSARANAENNYSMDRSRLIVSEVLVGKDMDLKRMIIMGRGRTGLLKHRHCRVTVILKEMPEEHFMTPREKRDLKRRQDQEDRELTSAE
ncbi:50S ribosomal protein L22 [Planoprotostelium fungivorum]|nr:50S ribosomal protein L22 [Planoprotostelium fungivorum]